MPEGPEAHCMASQLREAYQDRILQAIVFPDGTRRDFGDNTWIIDIYAYGKKVIWHVATDNSSTYITFSLGMTGKFRSGRGGQPNSHTKAELVLNGKMVDGNLSQESLYFDDSRGFGSLEIGDRATTSTLGPDPLSDEISYQQFNTLLGKRKGRLGTLLNNQGWISGIGNYLRAEILYRARLSPYRQANTLTEQEKQRLYTAILATMRDSLQCGGATLATYRQFSGEEGTFRRKVYGQPRDPHGNPVQAEKMGGQTIYWVPAVQK